MTLDELIGRLIAMGFRAQGPGAYEVTTRLNYISVAGGSVFVGEEPDVSYPSQATPTRLKGTGPFLIANGRSGGMTKKLTELDSHPTGTIPDPAERRSPDDPYWRDSPDLPRLIDAMERGFKP